MLIDLNMVLDASGKREPFYAASADVLAAAETGHMEGWITAHSVKTLFYLIAEDTSSSRARSYLTYLF